MSARKRLGLTLHRPWPILIGLGIKKVENRTWSPEPRLQPGEWFAIHAGKKYDERCSPMAQRLGVDMEVFFDKKLGAEGCIVAVARYAGCVIGAAGSADPWFFGPDALLGNTGFLTLADYVAMRGGRRDVIVEDLRKAATAARGGQARP
jgi:hypothetical protein